MCQRLFVVLFDKLFDCQFVSKIKITNKKALILSCVGKLHKRNLQSNTASRCVYMANQYFTANNLITF